MKSNFTSHLLLMLLSGLHFLFAPSLFAVGFDSFSVSKVSSVERAFSRRTLAECRQEEQELEQTHSELWQPYEEYYGDHPDVAQSVKDCSRRLDEVQDRFRQCLERQKSPEGPAEPSSGAQDAGIIPDLCELNGGRIQSVCLDYEIVRCQDHVHELRYYWIELLRNLPPPDQYWDDQIEECEESVRETERDLANCEGPGSPIGRQALTPRHYFLPSLLK